MTAAVLASAAAGFSAPVEILPSQMTASVGGKCLALSTLRPERGQTEVKVDKSFFVLQSQRLLQSLFRFRGRICFRIE
jgi:hypothetical protein